MENNHHYDVVIIGTGLAGYHLAKEWRKLDSQSSLLMITESEGGFYSKPQLSTSLKVGRSPKEIWVHSAAEMAEQLNATILPRSVVTSIDPEQKTLIIDDNEVFDYGQCVLAVGAEVNQPPLEFVNGATIDNVFAINQIEDYIPFLGVLEQAHHIVILGAGLIACEFADDLIASGYQVTVAAPNAWPLDSLVPEPVGNRLSEVLTEKGVVWHLNRTPKTISCHEQGYQVSFEESADLINADVVLRAAGIKPRLDLARSAGLKTQRGIVVDNMLRTSNPHIYALGDCAEINGLVYQYVAPILHCARALAKTLTGEETVVDLPVMPSVVKTSCYPIAIISPPSRPIGQWGEAELSADGGMFVKACDQQGQVCSVILSGDQVTRRAEILKQYFA